MLCENLKLIRQWEVSLLERVLSVPEIDFGNFTVLPLWKCSESKGTLPNMTSFGTKVAK